MLNLTVCGKREREGCEGQSDSTGKRAGQKSRYDDK